MAHVLGHPGAVAQLQRDLRDAGLELDSADALEALLESLSASLNARRAEEYDNVVRETQTMRSELGTRELALQKKTVELASERLRLAAAVADLRQQARSSDSAVTRFALQSVASVATWTRKAHLLHLEIPLAFRQRSLASLAGEVTAREASPGTWVDHRILYFRQQLTRAQQAFDDPSYAGALAEEEVAEELKTLPDTHWVLHDVLLRLPTPVRFRSERRQAVQIDHLVVGPRGVFVLETKRWSASSARDLPCPWHQTARNAFFVRCALRNQGIEPTVVPLLVNLGALPACPEDIRASAVRLEQLKPAVTRGSEEIDGDLRSRIADLLWTHRSKA